MIISVFATIIFGLGLFYLGLSFLTNNLKELTTLKIRQILAKWTQNKYLGVLWGGILVSITQSTAATTFVLVGMIRSNLISVKQSLPIVIGINLVIGFIVFILTLDIKIGVLFIIGLSSILYAHLPSIRAKYIIGAILGVSLLFLGIYSIQEALAPIVDSDFIENASNFLIGHYMIAFFMGCLLSVIAQSSLPVVILIIPLIRIDVISINEAMMYIYGANVGSSILTLILAWSLTGKAKQLAMFQVLYNIVGALIMIPLFYMELYIHTPLIREFALSLSNEPGQQVAIVYVLFNILPGFLLFFLIGPIEKVLDKIWAESMSDRFSKPKYLYEQALEDKSSAIELMYLEQIRLMDILRKYLECMRKPNGMRQREKFSEAFHSLAGVIDDFIKRLSTQSSLTAENYDRLNKTMALQFQLESIEFSMSKLSQDHHLLSKMRKGCKFAESLVEGLDIIIVLAKDLTVPHSEDDYQLLRKITSDDGNSIQKVRESYLSQDKELCSNDKRIFLAAANHTEHIIRLFYDAANLIHELRTEDK